MVGAIVPISDAKPSIFYVPGAAAANQEEHSKHRPTVGRVPCPSKNGSVGGGSQGGFLTDETSIIFHFHPAQIGK